MVIAFPPESLIAFSGILNGAVFTTLISDLDLPNMIWTVNKFAASAVLLGIAFASAKGQTFAPTGSMTTARLQHTATLLQNGKQIVAPMKTASRLMGKVERLCSDSAQDINISFRKQNC